MKRALLFSSGIAAIVAGVLALAYMTTAAVATYSFSGRGIVQEQDLSGGQIRVHWTHLSARAAQTFLGSAVDLRVGRAQILTRKADGTTVRIRQGNIAVGDEVTVRGAVQSDTTLVASKVVREDRSFTMKGKLKTFENGNRRMTIDVSSSTYKSSRYNGRIVTFIFGGQTKFFSGGRAKDRQDVTAADQKVQVDGKVAGDDLEVYTVYENIP